MQNTFLKVVRIASNRQTSVTYQVNESNGRLRQVLQQLSAQQLCALQSFSPKATGTRAAYCVHIRSAAPRGAKMDEQPGSDRYAAHVFVLPDEVGEPVKAYRYNNTIRSRDRLHSQKALWNLGVKKGYEDVVVQHKPLCRGWNLEDQALGLRDAGHGGVTPAHLSSETLAL